MARFLNASDSLGNSFWLGSFRMHPRILRGGYRLLHATDVGEAEQSLAIVFVACD